MAIEAGASRGKSRPRRKKAALRAGARPQGSIDDTIGPWRATTSSGFRSGYESQGDYGACRLGEAPPAAEGESREAMEAREIAYAAQDGAAA